MTASCRRRGGRTRIAAAASSNGGWATLWDSVIGSVAEESMGATEALLLGRRTYEDFHSYLPDQTNNPFTRGLTDTRKYVTSRTLQEPLPRRNSTLLEGDAAESVSRLKEQLSGHLVVLGGGELVQTLMRHALVDEYVPPIHPLVLGSGRRLFADGSATLRLVDAKTPPTGVLITTYQPLEQAAAKST